MDIDIEKIERLMRALREHDFHEVEIRQGDERITLRRGAGGAAGLGASFAVQAPERERVIGVEGAKSPAPVPAADPTLVTVTSPLVGTFYRAPKPDMRPFVEAGSLVRQGTVLCIIEAFKLMNEIESEVDGVVEELLVENGKPVEYGQALMRVRRSG